MSDSKALAKVESGAMATPSVGQMLQTVIDRGITNENVSAFEKLIELHERVEARNAQKSFTAAFKELQQEIPVIVAKTPIKNRGMYEKFEDLMQVVGPLLTKHGFTVSFDMDIMDTRIKVTCRLKHTEGHFEENSFAVRTGRADTDTQADCMAATTAKRNALMQALNIVIRKDAFSSENDPRSEGKIISEKRAMDLESRAQLVHMNMAEFLKLGGVQHFKDLTESKADVMEKVLEARERKGAK